MIDKYVKQEIEKANIFDPDWYAENYADVALTGLAPLEHFLMFGLMLNRDPSAQFDSRFYLSKYTDVRDSGIVPLVHYIRFGKQEGRMPVPGKAPDQEPKTPEERFATAPWAFRDARDAFMLRGLVPMAPIAVVVNIANEHDLQIVSQAMAAIEREIDLFVLGDLTYDMGGLPSWVRSLSHVGDADPAGNAKGFLGLAVSGALDRYEAVFWMSPADASSNATDLTDKLCRHAAKVSAFVEDADWGAAGLDQGYIRRGTDGAQIRGVSIAASRLGLVLPKNTDIAVPAGAGVWIKPLLFRGLGPTIRPFEMSADGAGSTLPGRDTILGLIGVFARDADQRLVPEAAQDHVKATLPARAEPKEVKAVAFYLPQFHPIPENDTWWGKGFTEWNNVTRGRPLFRNHYQPRVPADLGYYDLRLEDVQEAQGNLAREYGFHGFCYYYYWFNGTKLLNQPIEQMAKSQRTDAGFCVCWANENWSRNWDGQNRHVLMKQDYSLESNIALMRELIPMMKDPRWIRFHGKPVMVVYRISIIPNWKETAQRWREECRRAGLGEIHLCAVRFGLETLQGQPEDHGLDAYVLFPPHEAARKDMRQEVHDLHSDFGGEVFDYETVVTGDLERYASGYEWPVHRGAMLGWDNTARRLTSARIFHGATPYNFRRWIKGILEQEMQHNSDPETLMFVNAWNEWAEGTYLEPDQRWGHSNLSAFRSALRSIPDLTAKTVAKGTAKTPRTGAALERMGNPMKDGGTPLAPMTVHEGMAKHDQNKPTLLVCAHIAGDHLFGGERSLLDVVDALSQMPVNIVVTLPSGNNKIYLDELKKRSLCVYVFPYPQWMDKRPSQAWLMANFGEIIARHAVDVVHANTIVLLEPLLAAHAMGRERVVHSRELISLDEPLRERMNMSAPEIIEKVLGQSDWLIGNSEATCKLFARQDRTLYVPNAVTPSDFDMNNRYGKTIVFGIVSSNIPKKGVADFVEVARRAAARTKFAKFVVIGPDRDATRAWEAEVRAGTRPDNIVFAGYRNTPREAMSEMNVLLNLSQFAESFGRTVAEALVARRPVIAYEWGALPELLCHGETGFLVPYRDIDGVVDRVVELVENPDRIAEMGEAGRRFIEDNFSQTSLKTALGSAYAKILGRPMLSDQSTPDAPPPILRTSSIGKARDVTVVIPVYNAPDEARDAITAALRWTDPALARILVINDASPDPAVVPMLREFTGREGLTILTNETNLGYTRTVNRGIAEAGDTDVVLLNSDAEVTPKWLEGLRMAAYGRPKVATVTAMGDNAGAFSFPRFNEFCPKPDHMGQEEYGLAMVQAALDGTCVPPEVPTGSGFCMYIRREFLDAHGVFDHEGFPRGYGEENDFCMRALKAGWVNLITPWAFAYHERTASFKGEKTELVKAGVDVVTRRYPDYAELVREAFKSPDMLALRDATSDVS